MLSQQEPSALPWFAPTINLTGETEHKVERMTTLALYFYHFSLNFSPEPFQLFCYAMFALLFLGHFLEPTFIFFPQSLDNVHFQEKLPD